LGMVWGATISLTRPPSTVTGRYETVRRPPMHRRSTTGGPRTVSAGMKSRPRTPQLLGYSPCAPRRLLPRSWSEIQHHAGALRSWLPVRWNRGPQPETLTIQTESSASGEEHSVPTPEPSQIWRPTVITRVSQLRADREAAAESVGVDMSTYNLLMDLQHRDITPEDYETLRQLDTSVKPKTLSRTRLEARAPCWHVPSDPLPTASYRLVDQTCSICLEYFNVGERARRLPCSHVFHAHCIDEWLTRSSSICPEDGLPVLPDAPN